MQAGSDSKIATKVLEWNDENNVVLWKRKLLYDVMYIALVLC